MPETRPSERLQPALLDRLIDDEPESRVESRDRRVMSMRQLRAAVLRDLTWLLNASRKPLSDPIHDLPLASASVLNFGMPDLTGMTASGVTPEQMEAMVLETLTRFEPRIVPGTLAARVVMEDANAPGRGPAVVALEIRGELCPLPMPEALFLKTEVDLETGHCTVREEK
jgi:type VI secretion system protein ImpF